MSQEHKENSISPSKIVFEIISFPATFGDSFWVTYGTEDNLHHILIDGGTAGTRDKIQAHIETLPNDSCLELLVVTHYDSDHIEGIRTLLSGTELPIKIKEVWFNDYDRLDPNIENESFGAKMGEKLSERIVIHEIEWNTSFGGKAVLVQDELENKVPIFDLPGGLTLKLLSPYQKQLTELKKVWKVEVEKDGLEAGYGAKVAASKEAGIERFGLGRPDFSEIAKTSFNKDDSEGNGSSIAFVAEFGGKTVLFTGDAFSEVIMASLAKIELSKIDLMKVSHHGGARNTDPKLIEKIDCKHYLFSTNGTIRPTEQTIAYILKATMNPTFYFNYSEQAKRAWQDDNLKGEYGYETVYPLTENLIIDVLNLRDL